VITTKAASRRTTKPTKTISYLIVFVSSVGAAEGRLRGDPSYNDPRDNTTPARKRDCLLLRPDVRMIR